MQNLYRINLNFTWKQPIYQNVELIPPTCGMPFAHILKKIMASLKGPIVILEDDDDERELLQEAIGKMAQNKLLFFNKGEEVLEYLETTSERPFLIISDVNVPGLSGMQVKRRINASDFLRQKSIPFIFMSTTGSHKAVSEAYDLTVQGFFIKQNSLKDMERQLSLIFAYWRECRHTNSD